jgi:hypothetical protein
MTATIASSTAATAEPIQMELRNAARRKKVPWKPALYAGERALAMTAASEEEECGKRLIHGGQCDT